METNKLLLIFLLFTGVVACQEDEDIAPEIDQPEEEIVVDPAALVGQWRGREVVVDIQSDALTAPEHFVNSQWNALVEFLNDSTVTLRDDNIQSAGKWQFLNDNKDIMVSIDRFGNEYLDKTETYTIKHLSDTRLQLDLAKEDSIYSPTARGKIYATVNVTFHYDRSSGDGSNQ